MAKKLKILTLSGPAGGYTITHPKLAYASVITVKRNGARQYQVTTNPTGSDPNVRHISATGKLVFSSSLPFNFAELDEHGARKIELIHVIYTENTIVGGGGSGNTN